MSASLRPHGLQHARLHCPSPSPGVCSNSCPLMPSNHLIPWRPPLLVPSIFPNFRVFFNEISICWPNSWGIGLRWVKRRFWRKPRKLPWWLSGKRIGLAVHEPWVRSLVWEDPRGHGATKPMCHKYWAGALEPGAAATDPRARALPHEEPLWCEAQAAVKIQHSQRQIKTQNDKRNKSSGALQLRS